MKVLIVCDVLGQPNNGTTIAALNLIKYLREQGVTVRVLCADQDKIGQKDTFVVPTIYLGALAKHILTKNNVTLAKPVKKIISQAMEGVEIIHVLIPFALGIASAKLAREKGIPVTAGFHCQAENFTSHILHTMNLKIANDIVYKVFYKKLYRYVNAIHYPTEFIQNVFEEVIKEKTNGYVISNGVNDQYVKKEVIRSPELKNKFNILFIGRLSKEKSHPVLLKAVSLSKYKNYIQLIFAGQGPKVNKAYELAAKFGINKPIIKFYKRNELVNVINSCDLYVHPAEIEIEAISCLEAITCGLVPVISNSKRSATKAFALSEKNLFKCNDSQDLANKIDYWIEHPEEREECSKSYLGYTKKFNQDECMKRMYDMLKAYAKPINHTTTPINYYRDQFNDDFAGTNIKTKPTPANYKYVHKNIFYRFFQFLLTYIIAFPVIFFINKIKYKQKIVNHLTVPKNSLKGYFIYGNHVMTAGDAFTPNLAFGKRTNIITNPDAISIFGIKTIVSMLGAIPLPSTLHGTLNFLDAIKAKIKNGESITIYPESHIWPYYTDIRDFKESSFKYPIDLNAPVVCITNTFVPYKKSYRVISHIDGPFFPNINIGKKDAELELRNIIFETMKKRASEVTQIEKIRYINVNDIESD